MRLANKLSDFKSLFDMLHALPDDTACREYLELIYWNNTPTCPHCQCQAHYILKTKGEFKGMYKCKGCKQRYNVAYGTMFEASHISYRKWLIAIYIVSAHKKGISSHQLSRDLSVTQRTAWFMLHRIRHSMGLEQQEQLEGTVQLDETFCGGKNKNRHWDKKVEHSQGRTFIDKTPVMGMLQQAETEIIERPHKVIPGKIVKEKVYRKTAVVKCKVVPNTQAATLQPIIKQHVAENSIIVSDEWVAYHGLNAAYDHRIIDHRAKQYVDAAGNTTNALEGFWTWIKRSQMGIHHIISRKHLQKYADENAFRYTTCRMKDKQRFDLTLQQANNPRITYKQLTGKL
ncbi:MAG: IS1595 family transposase [Flavipsychrobacter sp.]|nr:IS1595 family transposase [Flavipsychrobacter sp.]